MTRTVAIGGVEESFDNDAAERLLSFSVDRLTYTSDIVRKSMYDFDLDTPEGIERLVALLPIMDPEILVDIMGEIWPGYPTEVDARRHRLEIKGYMKDFLEGLNNVDEADQGDGIEAVGAGSTTDTAPEGSGEGEQTAPPENSTS